MSYLFTESEIDRLIKFTNAKVRNKGDEVEFTYCPICHGGEHQDKYTFAVNRSTGMFKCMRSSCGKQGSFYTLAKEVGLPVEFSTKRKSQKTYAKLPQRKISDIAVRDNAIAYLNGRGIPETITRQYGITTRTDKQNILVFPFYDWNGNLTMVKYRNTQYQKGSYGSKEWTSKGTKPILFGIQNVNYENDTLVITEGQIDSLSLTVAGIENAVSVPMGKNNFEWINTCWGFLGKFKEIVVFGDNENGTITLANEISEQLKQHVIKVVRKENYHGCKDANEILQTYGKDKIVTAVKQAKIQEVEHCLSMRDVKRVNISDLPHISTGIAELDHIIGGFYEGQLVVLSGKRGEGKSTLGSQFMLEAVDQDVKSLIFSGELPNYLVKNWIDVQSAGTAYLTPMQTSTGQIMPVILDDTRTKIEEWYEDSLYIVDDTQLDENEDLLTVIEKIIYRKQIKMCLIDNLMCFASYDDNIYNNQGKIATKLKKIATEAQCTIILIVHERKMQGRDVSDNVSGSADITNRADVVLRLSRKNGSDSEGILQVAKNRLFGKLALEDNSNHIPTDFDELSRRISTKQSPNNNKLYSWAVSKDEVIKIDIGGSPEDLPF